MEQYCIYLRKSRADQEAEARGEMETLARHEQILLDLAKKRNYTISAVYKEVVSGETISARPVMQQLLSEVEAGLWSGVLVVEVERLARGDTIDQGIVSRAFQFSDTKIITPLKTYDPNNEFDEEYFEFGLFMSRREYKTIKRRLNAGRISSCKEGKYVGSKPPYGYERIKLHGEKGYTLSPLPNQSQIVSLIYQWYVHGIDGERLGVSKIVRRLNDLHIPAATGGDWVPASVQGILSNPVYIGKIVWNRRKTVKKVEDGRVISQRPRSNDYLLSDGLHPGIVPEDLFYAAQDLRKHNPARPINTRNVVKNPLSGLVFCSACGRRMVRRPYSGKQKDTLMCPYTSCRTVSSQLALVEKAVLQGLDKIVQQYKLNNDTAEQDEGASVLAKEELLIQRQKEVELLEAQKRKQYDLLEQGVYTVEIFTKRSSELAQKISDLSAAISSLSCEIEHDKEMISKKELFIPQCEYLLEKYWSWDISTRNNVLKSLVDRITYTKTEKNHYGDGNLPTFQLDIHPKIPQKTLF